TVRRRLFQGDYLPGSGNAGMEPGGTDGEKHSGHALLRGGDSPGDGGSGAESLKKILFRCRLTANTVYWTEDSSGKGLSGKSCSAGKDRVLVTWYLIWSGTSVRMEKTGRSGSCPLRLSRSGR